MAAEHDVDFTKLDTSALAHYAHRKKCEAEYAQGLADLALDELKSRTKVEGTTLYGDTVAVAYRTKRFVAKTAKAVLTPTQYAAICAYKPDAKLAKKVLGEDSVEYQSSCEEYGWTVKLREATEEDYEVELGRSSVREAGIAKGDEAPF
jgi:hypothetical protein